MHTKYPFDASIKHHALIALGLALWIFIFLYFTVPFDVNELTNTEKLLYLPGYGFLGAILYVIALPFQYWLFNKKNKTWTIASELLFLLFYIFIAIVVIR
ncbi:MAG: LytTR family transcriptional regulator, partial [Oceanihabitans sp.]